MKLEIEQPSAPGRHQPAAADARSRSCRRRPANRRAGAQLRRRRRRRGARALPGAVAGAARRRLGAAAQQGVDRRQPAAAHALRLLLRHRRAVQQARARRRLRGDRRVQPRSTRSSGASEACIATHPSDMAVAMTALDARIELLGADGVARSVAIARLLPAARRHAAHRDRAAARRADHRASCCRRRRRGRQLYRKVRDRASYEFALVSVGGDRLDRAGNDRRGAGRVRRRGAQAVALARGRGRAARPPRHDGHLPGRRRCRARAARWAAATTTSRSSWPEAHAVPRRWPSDPGGEERDDRTPLNRVDGPLKVTGRATYAYEHGTSANRCTGTSSARRSARAASPRSTPPGRNAHPACTW